MEQKYNPWYFFTAIVSLFFCQNALSQNASVAGTNTRFRAHKLLATNKIPKEAVEDESMRTPHSSFYHIGNKVIACYSTGIVNYTDKNGKLQPVKISLKSDPNGWVAAQQPNPCYFRSDRSTAIDIGNGQTINFNMNCTVDGATYDQQIESMDETEVNLNLTTEIHKYIDFVNNGIETSYIFDKPLENGISVTEEISFPQGCTFKRDEGRGKEIYGGWAGDYVLLSPDGRVLTRFCTPVCFDAAKHRCDAIYKLKEKDGKYQFTVSIPSAWLSAAIFPVTLDPLVKGPTSLEGGDKLKGSCLLPSYSSDSLLVTIPGKITITDLDIDYSYTTVSTITETQDMNIGRFYFSTTCGSTPVLYCDSAYPGTCYLVPNNDFHPWLTCCYDPLCVSQNFWLVAHLARTVFPGCPDTNIVWHDEKDSYPFDYAAYILGYTDSLVGWGVTPVTQCANSCGLTLSGNIEYGVPPYRVSHPWALKDTVVGKYSSCVSKGAFSMKLNIPGCPYNCGKSDTLYVPPPMVIDACNDTVKNVAPTKIRIILNPVPLVTVSPDTVKICSGTPVTLNLTSCFPGTNFSWKGSNKTSGTSSTITTTPVDTGKTSETVTYTITGSANGCNSDTVKAVTVVSPYPVITASGSATINLGSSDTMHATGGGNYSWSPVTGLSCVTCPNPVATPSSTTMYTVTVTDSGGCSREDSVLVIIKEISPPIVIPNVITPNGDGKNDFFAITNLQYYPNSQLIIFNRWGEKVLTSDNYLNNWNGGGQSDGVYYYILTLPNGKKYKGYLQIIK